MSADGEQDVRKFRESCFDIGAGGYCGNPCPRPYPARGRSPAAGATGLSAHQVSKWVRTLEIVPVPPGITLEIVQSLQGLRSRREGPCFAGTSSRKGHGRMSRRTLTWTSRRHDGRHVLSSCAKAGAGQSSKSKRKARIIKRTPARSLTFVLLNSPPAFAFTSDDYILFLST